MAKVYEIIVIFIIALAWLFVYQNYWDDLMAFLFSEEPVFVVYLDDVAIEVTIADDRAERIQGLSGVTELGDFEGKLFIFDESDTHGIWMKDMNIPIDILWFDEDLRLVHSESNVTPDTYPANIYVPDEPARFVLETNAYFMDSLRVQEGERLIVPPVLLPTDVRERLQQ